MVGFSAWPAYGDQVRNTQSTESSKKKSRDLSHLRVADLHALVVGVSTYNNPKISPLKFAAKDATDFAEFIKSQQDLYKNVNVKLLVNEKATRAEIEKFLLYDVRNAGKDDSVILYFSGHGAIDPRRGGEYFFVTHDADPDYLGATGVLMSCSRFFKGLEARHVLVYSDTCHAGSFSAMEPKSVSSSMESFIDEFRSSSGRVIFSSSKPDEYSMELADLDNGVFTHFLLEALRGAADKDRDGVVTAREAYDYVYGRTKDLTQGAQHPQFEGKLVGFFPVSIRPPGGTLQLTTEPPMAEVYLRDESSLKPFGKTDGKGHLSIEDLPLGEPIIVVVKKTGWHDRILDPMAFSRERLQIRPETIKMEPALAFLLLRTNTSGVHVSIGSRDVGEIGSDNFVIIDKVQVGIPHELLLRRDDYHDQKLTVEIPTAYEGRVYRIRTVEMTQKATVAVKKEPPKPSQKPEPAREPGEKPGGLAGIPGSPAESRAGPPEAQKDQQQKLFDAAKAGSVSEVKTLLNAGADVNASDRLGWTALMHACSSGRKEVAELLIDRRADVNFRDRLGWTALMVAAGNGDEELVKLLLKKGVDTKSRNMYGETAATRAQIGQHASVLKLLGVAPTPPPAASQPSESAATGAERVARLFQSVKKGDRGGLEKVLAEGTEVNASDELGWTPLMHACALGRPEMVRLLIEKKANVNYRDRLGWTPLMIAAGKGDEGIVKLLLDKGAEKSASNVYGETAAMRASVGNHVEVMKILGVSVPAPAGTQATKPPERPRDPRERPARPQVEEGTEEPFSTTPATSDEDQAWHIDGRPAGHGPWRGKR